MISFMLINLISICEGFLPSQLFRPGLYADQQFSGTLLTKKKTHQVINNSNMQKEENTGTLMESNYAVDYSGQAKHQAQSSSWLNGKHMSTDD